MGSLPLKLISLLSIFLSLCQGIQIYPNGKYNLLWYDHNNANTYYDFTKEIDDLFEKNRQDDEDETKWGPCVSPNAYSFSSISSGPCVFLHFPEKLKATPSSYNSSSLPQDAPEHLRHHIRTLESRASPRVNNVAYVFCDGKQPVDKENIGPLLFYPSYELSILSNRFGNNLIGVYFERPMRNIIINVECTIWANFKNKDDLEKSVIDFDLLIE